MVKKALGRGLDALITAQPEEMEADRNKVLEIDINQIEPNREQPRQLFNKDELEELAESIRTYGILSPIVVRKEGEYYTIVAGERRWRAARLAGLKVLPVLVRDFDEKEVLEVALIENLQRADLNPMEEATSYKKLINEFNMTQEDIAARLGKSRSSVANALRLLNLPDKVGELIKANLITTGHAKVILGVDNAEEQFMLAEKVADENLSVRELEHLIKKKKEEKTETKEVSNEPTHDKEQITQAVTNIAKELESVLGTRVNIKTGRQGKGGRFEIEYFTPEEFERLYLVFRNIR